MATFYFITIIVNPGSVKSHDNQVPVGYMYYFAVYVERMPGTVFKKINILKYMFFFVFVLLFGSKFGQKNIHKNELKQKYIYFLSALKYNFECVGIGCQYYNCFTKQSLPNHSIDFDFNNHI